MGRLALRVEGIGKQYSLGGGGPSYDTLADALGRIARAPLRWLGASAPSQPRRTFWPLKDVSFEVPPGQVLGVVGRNGAGKSTLLKVLSGVTEPTEGAAAVWGSMGALLEVGTGFHPELTGRENVYLNGAILGMRRAEVARKFDEIVAFSGVERFIDTPAKHYSSGMYMRLAFAVAAHLETEILLVDEVLAVGDAEFQRKCLQKMEQVGTQGRAVLFVSHDMSAVTRLCSRAILLEQGHVLADGDAPGVIHQYLHGGAMHGAAVREWPHLAEAPGDGVAKLRAVRVLDDQGRPAPEVDIRRPLRIEVDFWNLDPAVRPAANVHLFNDQGQCLFISCDFTSEAWKAGPRPKGLVRSVCHIPGNFLSEGLVSVLAAVSSFPRTAVHAIERDAVAFTVVDRSEGDGARGSFAGPMPGAVRPLLEWTLQDLEQGGRR